MPPLVRMAAFVARMSRMAGNRSRLAGKSKRDPVVRPHELRHVVADRVGSSCGPRRRARAGEQPDVRPCRPLSRLLGGRRAGGRRA